MVYKKKQGAGKPVPGWMFTNKVSNTNYWKRNIEGEIIRMWNIKVAKHHKQNIEKKLLPHIAKLNAQDTKLQENVAKHPIISSTLRGDQVVGPTQTGYELSK